MKYHKVGLAVAGMLLVFGWQVAARGAPAKQRPNILVIFSDDHAQKALSCYGNTDIETPGLDRLAAEGMRFTHAVTPNSFCTPSRAVVLTGKYSHKNGVTHLNQSFDGSQQTFPKLLQEAGYETSLFGKWHLLSQPTGFDFYCVQKMQGMPVDPLVFETGTPWVPWSPQDQQSYRQGGRKLKGYNNDVITSEALTWLKSKRNTDKPFCLCLHPKPPHQPYKPPPEYEDFLEDVFIPEPVTLLDDYEGRTPKAIENVMGANRLVLGPAFKEIRKQLEKENPGISRDALTRGIYQEFIKSYYRLVKSVDDNVARVLDYLDESGLADDTLVIYTSDQGFSLGEHGFYNKQWMYEAPLHQPLLVRLPGVIAAGSVHESLVSHVDLAPTILDYAGVTVPRAIQGHSLKNLLEQRANKVRDAVYYHFYEHGKQLPEMIGIRTETHKLIHYPGMPEPYQWELFDLESDPNEMHNLAGKPEHEPVRDVLLAELRALVKEVDDSAAARTLGERGATVAVPQLQPNIVHIMVDDLGWQDVGCYYRDCHADEPFYETPNLDRLASRGIRFTQAYSPAMTCAPSRAAFMTGQYTPHNGVYHVNMGCEVPRPRRADSKMLDPYYVGRILPGKPTVPQVLTRAGYETAHVGKWHLAGPSGVPSPLQAGFGFSFDAHKHYNDPTLWDQSDPKQANTSGLFAQPKNRLKNAFDDPRFPLLEDERPYDSMLDLATKWLRKQAAEEQKPFFLNLCPNLVHGPVMTRDKKRLAHYCRKLGIEFPTDQGSIADPAKPGQHNPYYASMVDSVDWIIGQVVAELERLDDPRNTGHKLIDNTYVVISSDNGGAQQLRNWPGTSGKAEFEKVTDNAPLREGKGWAYEGGCRIPFIVVGPGIAAGAVNRSTPVNLIDLLPTFAAMAGAPVGSELNVDGCNLVPVLQGEEEVARHADGSARDMLYFHYPVLNGAFSTIRQGPWKLLKNTALDENTAPAVQLFQLSGTDGEWLDLSEAVNLIEEHRDIAARLLAKLDAWLRQHTAGQPYKNASYRKGGLPGQENVPAILGRGHSNGKIWATYETGAGKAAIQQAFLLYTINPGAGEEWFQAEAVLADGRVEAVVPPGMTHGIFCLVDANNFLLTSEPVPSMQEFRKGRPVSEILKDGYAYRPGLEALVGLGRRAMAETGGKGVGCGPLSAAMEAAETLLAEPDDPPVYARAISRLREAIRACGGAQAAEPALNWFPRVSGDGT